MDDVLLVCADREALRGRHRPAGRGAARGAGGGGMKLIYEKSRAGPAGVADRRSRRRPRRTSPAELARREPPRLPELAEPELVRHFTELSTRTFGIDTGFYPLGSCTMKYNPRINERAGGLPGFRDLHPHQADDGAQGALELMWRLQEMLAEMVGLDAVYAAAGRRRAGRADRPHADARLLRRPRRGRSAPRSSSPTPPTAPTRPASRWPATRWCTCKTDARGNVDLDDLRDKVGAAHRRADADQPLDAGAVRGAHRRDRRHRPRGRGAPLLRRRQPERRVRHLPARRHGLRHHALQPAQDVLPAPRRRRARRRAGGGPRHARAVPAGARSVVRDGRPLPARLRPPEVDRQGARASAARSACSCAPTRSCGCGARACARCPRSRC